MYFRALATDYDGTLADHGHVADYVLDELRRFRATGRKLIMVSGRELPDLRTVFDAFNLFDLMVLENGALLYDPRTGEEQVLADPPPPAFVELLKQRGVARLSVGRVIVATWVPYENIVLDTIRDLGLEMQIIFNKDAVMVLPSGVNKATGLAAALERLELSPLHVVGIGDAENDHAFLQACGAGVAVDNALPMLKADADLVTKAARSDGVLELIGWLQDDEERHFAPALARHRSLIGHDAAVDNRYTAPAKTE